MSPRNALQEAATFAGLAYIYGLVLGALGLAWQLLVNGARPHLSWWQWALAPLAIGGIAMGGEFLVHLLQSSTGFGNYGSSKLRRLVHLAILMVVMAALIIGPAIYNIATK